VLPSGGFGNLIALPLQLHARRAGKTKFLNTDLEPHQDQWLYLASVPRIAPDLLDELIAQSDQDETLAVRSPTEDAHVPWRPPRTLRQRLREAPMPEIVAATLADRLYVDRSALPPALAHAIKRLATFSNPMFLERQRMRMSVARTPRMIGCFEDLVQHIAIPRGCLREAEALLAEFNVRVELQDARVS
jgi:hypothetical protein